MIDESYIKTADPAMQEVLYDTMYNISFLLGDDRGKLWYRDAGIISKNLQVYPDATIQEIGDDLSLPNDSLLGKETFFPRLSSRAFSVHQSLSNYTTKEMPAYEPDISLIFEDIEYSSDMEASYRAYLYLELYSLLLSIVEYRGGDILTVTLDEISTLLSNCRYIVASVGTTGNQESTYKLLNVLKHIQRSILFVKEGILSVLR